MREMFKRLQLLFGVMLLATNCLASNKTIELLYDFPIHLSLSTQHVNRIHFANKPAWKIIGDTSKYNIIFPKKLSSLILNVLGPFLLPIFIISQKIVFVKYFPEITLNLLKNIILLRLMNYLSRNPFGVQ